MKILFEEWVLVKERFYLTPDEKYYRFKLFKMKALKVNHVNGTGRFSHKSLNRFGTFEETPDDLKNLSGLVYDD